MRIRWLGLAAVLVLLGALSVLSARAQDDQPIVGLISVNNADVRLGPDFAYDPIGQLPLNASITILGRAGDFFYRWDGRQWLEIDYGDRHAWLYARLARTSIPFNDIPPTGMLLPRDRNGRVPEVFDLSTNLCDQWQGGFSLTGNFMAGDQTLTVTYPGLLGANVYSVITISPTGFRTAFDSETTTATIELKRLPQESGTYTWRVAPYWTNETDRYYWQQVCLLRTGGTFERP